MVMVGEAAEEEVAKRQWREGAAIQHKERDNASHRPSDSYQPPASLVVNRCQKHRILALVRYEIAAQHVRVLPGSHKCRCNSCRRQVSYTENQAPSSAILATI